MAEKSVLTSFQVRAAPEGWSKYTTSGNTEILENWSFASEMKKKVYFLLGSKSIVSQDFFW